MKRIAAILILGGTMMTGAATRLPPSSPGLPPFPYPTGRKPSEAVITLGARLFYETRFSKSGDMSCATCHIPTRAFSGLLSEKPGQLVSKAPSLLNVVFRSYLMHDGRAQTLESQAKLPLYNPYEMGSSPSVVRAVVFADDVYKREWHAAFGHDPGTEAESMMALAAYEGTLISGVSRFDRAYYAGERSAMTEGEWRGLTVFTGKAGCARCHTISPGFALFTDNSFHNIGTAVNSQGILHGLASTTGNPRHEGALRTPSLREVARTAPYMHDGRFRTLDEVIDYYNQGGSAAPGHPPLLTPLNLSVEEKRDLAAFLKALSSWEPSELP